MPASAPAQHPGGAGGSTRPTARPRHAADGRNAMTRIWPLPCEGLGNSPYLGLAAAHGLGVAFTADTHVHADFVSGGRELAADGARLLAPAASGLSFPHEELRGGEDLDLGGLTLRALATPGHTPEHLSYLLLDGAQPVAVFTGGALIAGGVARTDLAGPARAEEWTRAAYRSAQALLGLPGDLAAYPTHGPGSFCSAGETGQHVTTIGRERDGNPLRAAARHLPPGPGRPDPRARRRAGRRGRDDRGCQAGRGVRRGSRPRIAVERAARGVRDLAGLARQPRPPADRGARSGAGPRGAGRGRPAGGL